MSRFLRLIDTAPDAIVVTRPDGLIDLVNVQTERMFGYARDELLGQPVELLVPERFRSAHAAHRGRFSLAPTARPMGSRVALLARRKDGSEFPAEISLGPVESDEGTLVAAAIRDITERERIEAAARAANELLVHAVEIMEDAFAVFDRHGRLVTHNGAYRALFPPGFAGPLTGLTAEQMIDRALALTPFETDAQREQARAERLAIFDRPAGLYRITQGGRTLRVATRSTQSGERVMTLADLTEDDRREEELRRASAAKSEFLSSMSHELRTPLNAILGFASLLLRDRKAPLADRHHEMVEHILKGGQHLLRLVDEVLDLSKVEAGRVTLSQEPVEVAATLAEVVAALEPLASRANIELALAPPPSGLPMVTADRTRLAQVLMNFGSNAIKYGRPGGHARFTAAPLDDGFVRVAVSDDGVGIPPNKHDRIFLPFERAGQEHGAIEGTGIGLALSRRLAELMGGRVGFRSAPDAGSEFWLDLPARAPLEVRARPAAPEHGALLAGAGGPRHGVVYIEDNPSNVAFMRALLADFDRIELHVAPSAEIGVEVVRARKPRVVIMDINLPGMSGFEGLELLKRSPETCDIPVVALSAAAMDGDTRRAASAGFHAYLTKPVNVDELVGLLEGLLAGG